METFYKLPIKIGNLFQENMHPFDQCSEKESIDQHLELLFTTYPGEHKFDKEFGCQIWMLDFERLISQKQWEEIFCGYLVEAIGKYEPRLSQVEITSTITDVTYHNSMFDTDFVKKKANILVTATLNSTQERCRFRYKLLLGPLTHE